VSLCGHDSCIRRREISTLQLSSHRQSNWGGSYITRALVAHISSGHQGNNCETIKIPDIDEVVFVWKHYAVRIPVVLHTLLEHSNGRGFKVGRGPFTLRPFSAAFTTAFSTPPAYNTCAPTDHKHCSWAYGSFVNPFRCRFMRSLCCGF